MSVTVILITYNEELHLERALASVSSFAERIVVVDSFSTDRTLEIASRAGAEVLSNPFVSHARQFQWGIDNAKVTTDWVMRLDADEIVEPALAEEIAVELPRLSPSVVGVKLKRKHIFLNRWIRWGGRYPIVLLRIWRNGHGRVEDTWMDEHIETWGGETVQFKGDLCDWNLNDLKYFTDKHNSYSTREAVMVLDSHLSFINTKRNSDLSGNDRRTRFKRIIKKRLYNKMPFALSVFLYFTYRYIFKLGFLDGKEGLIYHFLQGGWYRFLVGAKLTELESRLGDLRDPIEIKREVERLTGLKFD